MDRRSYLSAVASTGLLGTAGCLTDVFADGPDGVVLDEPDDQLADSEDLPYPAYGETLPAFELPDGLSNTVFDSTAMDRTALLTGVFTFCPDECGVLLNRFAGVQSLVDDLDRTDGVLFLPITFDPERDDETALRESSEMMGADLSLGNWRFLRPETPDRARTVVRDRLGIDFERTAESDRVEHYDFLHIVVTLLVNPGGVVERAYRGENIDPEKVTDDIDDIVANYDPAIHD